MAENLFPDEHAAMFSLIYDDGVTPLLWRPVLMSPPLKRCSLCWSSRPSTSYPSFSSMTTAITRHLSRSSTSALSLLTWFSATTVPTHAWSASLLQAAHPKSSSAVTHSGFSMIPLLSLRKWFTSAVACASSAHPERHHALALGPPSLSLMRQRHR
jgi:hypothetical protein